MNEPRALNTSQILRVNEQGDLLIPSELLGSAPPKATYRIQVADNSLIIHREAGSEPSQKAHRWRQWAASHPSQPLEIPDAALQRESIYE
ncbi:MAG: hypothetical protein NW237_05615 [Cyanobacteriota bacterium]|nr:hypothetical protein [Cyanobacteriota bacterium]